mmetsp:Transcript_7043/g.20595  ORF Transcript_7043/g.20595 Transcript_7043/m.20595 type:complete len:292 (+) Transcript_7043:995-1870(+)
MGTRHASMELDPSTETPWLSARNFALGIGLSALRQSPADPAADWAQVGRRGGGQFRSPHRSTWQLEVEASAQAAADDLRSSSFAGAAVWHQQAVLESPHHPRRGSGERRSRPSTMLGKHTGNGVSMPLPNAVSLAGIAAGELSEVSTSAAQMHPASLFPDTLQGYIAQVRWSGFSVLLVKLGGALVRLHASVNDLLPLLPGSTLRAEDAPPDINMGRWGRVAATLQELKPYLRDVQPGVGASQGEGFAASGAPAAGGGPGTHGHVSAFGTGAGSAGGGGGGSGGGGGDAEG